MKTTRNTAQVQGVHLQPTLCADEAEVLEVAMDGVRRRPVMARNKAGELVVCCSRTARKHGWAIEGKLFNTPGAKKAPKATKAETRLEKLEAMESPAVPAPVKRRPVATPPKAPNIHAASNARIGKMLAEEKAVADMLGE